MNKMEIKIVDINDSEHPLKTGEMLLDRVNNVMYVGAQFGASDIDLNGLLRAFNIIGIFSRRRALLADIKDVKINIDNEVIGRFFRGRATGMFIDNRVDINVDVQGSFSRG